ncbi:hypothetical protein, partial [Bacteroides uniformis]|uniref:hypothetical protein n=1 Tax=Bacteroides uniformis TaxID=820 RepID=UPI0020308216
RLFFIRSFPLQTITSLIINRLTLFKPQKVFQKAKPINNYNIFVSAIKLKKTVTFKHKRL